MTTRGKVTAAVLVLGAAVAGAVVLWPTPEQISEQIKASAQARLDASLLEGIW